MRSFTTVLFAAALSGFASAQQYTIDPDSVPQSTRDAWCQSQITQCPLICLQTAGNSAATDANSCNSDNLSYACVCSNGLSPNVSEYSQTLPYYVCTEWGNQCVSGCGQDNTCSNNCRANHPCGAQNPTRVNTSTITTSMSKTSSGLAAGATSNSAGVVYTGLGGSDSAATTTGGSSSSQTSAAAAGANLQSGAQKALQVGQAYGMFVVAGAIFGGFALLL